MAAIGTLFPTLVDLVKKMGPDGTPLDMVELFSKTNAHLQDIAWKEGNLPTGHKFGIRTALPTPQWRRLNQGIQASKSQSDTLTETCGMLEGLSKVDVSLANLYGNPAAYRKDEDDAFFMNFGITVADALFYASLSSTPEQIQGFTPRLAATAGNPASTQIIKADTGATGAVQTSVWLIGWSPKTIYGIYPKASKAGIASKDMGEQLVKDAAGTGEFRAYVTHHKWDLGLCVQDWRYLARICNVDTVRWKADLASGADLVLSMTDAITALYSLDGVQPVFYMTRAAFGMFNKQLLKKGTSNLLEYLERGGNLVPHFLGVPIRIVDALRQNEAIVA